MAALPRVRKNIDRVTPQELADYQHAISKLLDISSNDPQSIDGYTYFEQLHDGDLGPCEHGNDTFMPWHRAHLFLFEEALRRSDPPRTETVTVPYWDWSALPSGKRYPTAFENQNSVLFHEFRNDRPICRTDGASGCDSLPFPRTELDARVLSIASWSTPDPPRSHLTFGGHAGGEQDCSAQFGLGFGALEQPAHNTMHDSYIGGDMAQPSFAALDPIFFSFHCYLDLLWAQWQERFDTDTDLEARLCGLFKDREHLPEHRFRVKDLLDTKQLGYIYEYTPGEPAPARPAVAAIPLFPAHPAFDFVVSARKEPELVRTLDITIPEPGVEAAHLLLTGMNVTTPFSYSADIYLTPAGEELRLEDREFRATHLADLLYFWRTHHGGHDGRAHDLTVDLGGALKSLAETHAGEQWRVSVALGASQTPPRPHHREHEHGAAAHPEGDLAETMDFGDLMLNLY
jgi:Common central domain of tyrosinase